MAKTPEKVTQKRTASKRRRDSKKNPHPKKRSAKKGAARKRAAVKAINKNRNEAQEVSPVASGAPDSSRGQYFYSHTRIIRGEERTIRGPFPGFNPESIREPNYEFSKFGTGSIHLDSSAGETLLAQFKADERSLQSEDPDERHRVIKKILTVHEIYSVLLLKAWAQQESEPEPAFSDYAFEEKALKIISELAQIPSDENPADSRKPSICGRRRENVLKRAV